MKQPEIMMSADWPENWSRDQQPVSSGGSLHLSWPVPLLPQDMGYLPAALQIEGDPTGQYYLDLYAYFYEEHVNFSGDVPGEHGWHPTGSLDYEELAYLIQEADTAVRGADDPPPSMLIYQHYEPDDGPARRIAGRLFLAEPRAWDTPESPPFTGTDRRF